MKTARTGGNFGAGMMMLFVGLAGVAVSLFAAAQIRSAEKERLRQHVRQRAHDLQVLLAGRVREYNLAAWYLRKSMLWIGPEDSRQFSATARGLLTRFPELQAVEWSPRVKASQRGAMEAALGKVHSGFRFTEPDDDGTVRAVGPREEYCVTGFVEPLAGNERAVGLDLLQSQSAAVLEAARDEARMMLTAPIRLVQEQGVSAGVVLYIPFYRDAAKGEATIEDRRARFGGVFQLVFRADDLFGRLLDSDIVLQAGFLPGPMPELAKGIGDKRYILADLDFAIMDRDAGGTLYFRPAPLRDGAIEPPVDGLFDGPNAAFEEIHFAGRHWRLSLNPSPSLMAAHLSGVPAGVLASGLAFTLLLISFIGVERRRAAEVEEEVVDRTADLERSVRELTERQKRLRQVELTLMELGRLRVAESDRPRAAFEEVCARIARAFEIDRVGVWLFDADRGALRCEAEFRLAEKRARSRIEIGVAACPEYFEAIGGNRVIAAVNARRDPRTAKLAEILPEEKEVFSRLDAPVHKGGELVGVISHVSERGHRRWSQEEETLSAAAGDFVGMLMVENERLTAERRLRDSERLYHSLVENLPQFVFRKDLEGRFTFVNLRLADALGRHSVDVVGCRDGDLFPPEQARRFEADDRKVISTGEAVEMVEEIELPGGTAFFHTSKTPLCDAKGRTIGVQGVSWDVSERFRLEEALQASDERFRGLVDRLDCIVWEADPNDADFPFVFVSRQVEELLGFPPTLLVEEPDFWRRHVVSEDQERVLTATRAALAAGEDVTLEYRVRSADGREVWLRDMVSLDTAPDGRVTAMRGVMVDITGARRLEAELKSSAERMRIFIERAPTAVAMFDREMFYLSASRRWYEENGFGDRDIVGRSHYELVPDVPERWRRIHRHCLKGNTDSCEEDPYPRADGGLDYVRWEIHPWHEPSGTVGGIVMFSEIITERVKARLANEQGEAILQATGRAAEALLKAGTWRAAVPEVLEALGEATGSVRVRLFENVVDGDLRRSWERFEWRRDKPTEVRGAAVDSGAGIEWRSPGLESVGERLAEGGVVRGGREEAGENLCSSLGAGPETSLFLLPVRLRGDWWGLMVFEATETGREWSAAEVGTLKGAADNLAAAIERELAAAERLELERGMQDAQKLESLGVLAGGIAHDFNNLLTAIVGNAGLLRLDIDKASPLSHPVEIIENTAMRASDLCRQLLAYAGKGRFEMKAVDLNEIVRDTAELLRVSVSKKAVLEQSLGAGPPLVWGDAAQLRQIVMNLVINASEALGDRSGTISLRTGRRELRSGELSANWRGEALQPGDYVFLEVRDDGCGMSTRTMRRVFEPFFSTKFTGRGLGMAAVLGIVKSHQGALRVESEEGKGTTFELLLPPSTCDVGAAPRAAGMPTAEVPLGNRRVLIVEDERDVRTVADTMLRKWGFQTAIADDGRSGVELFAAEKGAFDLVLMDMTMPGFSGIEAAGRMRAIRPGVKILLVSSYDESGAVADENAGIDGFVQKPFRWSRLKSAMLELLGGVST